MENLKVNTNLNASVLPQFMESVHVTFIILAILCAIGVFTSWKGVKSVRD